MAKGKIDVLMTGALMPFVVEQLEQKTNLHRLPEASDRDAGLAALGPKVRAIASGAHAPVDAALIGRLPKLEIVAGFGVGYDHIDSAAAAGRGVIVTNTPDVLNEEVADTALGLLLCAVRRLPQADRFLRAGRWLDGAFPLTATLRHRTLGILGLGRIGKAIARRAEAFGMRVVYHGRNPQEDVPYLYYPTLVGMARAVDVLLAITPGGEGTKGIVNAEALRALGPNGVFINVARGSVVDEAALIKALREKQILCAGLDVFVDEPRVPQALIELDNVVLLPHVGSGSVQAREAMGQLVVDNILSWSAGKGPLTPVAETPWPRASGKAR